MWIETYLLPALYFFGAFFFMEAVAWFTHKYVMHGFLWVWHRDHHEKGPRRRFFEKNDLFGVFFAGISMVLIVHGSSGFKPTFYLGLGVAAYGLAYVLFHDIFVHRRAPILKNSKWSYLNMLRRAHHAHHVVTTKEGARLFGFFFIAPRYWKKFWPKPN